jgi:hypothetical protein
MIYFRYRSRVRAPVWPGTFLRKNINMMAVDQSQHKVVNWSFILLYIISSVKTYGPGYGMETKPPSSLTEMSSSPAWQGRSIAGPKLRLVEFSAFLEQQRDPEQVGQGPLGDGSRVRSFQSCNRSQDCPVDLPKDMVMWIENQILNLSW